MKDNTYKGNEQETTIRIREGNSGVWVAYEFALFILFIILLRILIIHLGG